MTEGNNEGQYTTVIKNNLTDALKKQKIVVSQHDEEIKEEKKNGG
jgi:hypothetical protein